MEKTILKVDTFFVFFEKSCKVILFRRRQQFSKKVYNFPNKSTSNKSKAKTTVNEISKYLIFWS